MSLLLARSFQLVSSRRSYRRFEKNRVDVDEPGRSLSKKRVGGDRARCEHMVIDLAAVAVCWASVLTLAVERKAAEQQRCWDMMLWAQRYL